MEVMLKIMRINITTKTVIKVAMKKMIILIIIKKMMQTKKRLIKVIVMEI